LSKIPVIVWRNNSSVWWKEIKVFWSKRSFYA